jgi:acetyl esterase/lipase
VGDAPIAHLDATGPRAGDPEIVGDDHDGRAVGPELAEEVEDDLSGGAVEVAGRVVGNAATHDRLVRELAVGANAAVVFVEYARSPEARYPIAIEQAYATARWIVSHGATERLDATRLAVAGDSAGGNLAAALTFVAKQRGDVTFLHQSLYYPVTDAAQDSDSYWQFADGPYLTAKAMAWFWDAYLPHRDQRFEITASPLRATLDELAGLPEAFVIVDENDVLRDEGEAYARRLTAAGVRTTSMRCNGTCHDFLMLNRLRGTAAATAALEQATFVLRKALTPTDQYRQGREQRRKAHVRHDSHHCPRPRRVRRVRPLELGDRAVPCPRHGTGCQSQPTSGRHRGRGQSPAHSLGWRRLRARADR